jgi:uroporphyrinogen-III synthase
VTGWRVLLTRPAEESAALAASLSEAGIFSSCLPLLATEPLPITPEHQAGCQGLDRYCAVIVVSKPAARVALQLLDQYAPAVPALPWFSVGAATAQVLADQGLDVSYPEVGDDSEALLEVPRLREAVAIADARVLILRGQGGRELLAERLRGQGASVDYLELYRRFLPAYDPDVLAQRIAVERLNGWWSAVGRVFCICKALPAPIGHAWHSCRCSCPAPASPKWRGRRARKKLWIAAVPVPRLC